MAVGAAMQEEAERPIHVSSYMVQQDFELDPAFPPPPFPIALVTEGSRGTGGGGGHNT